MDVQRERHSRVTRGHAQGGRTTTHRLKIFVKYADAVLDGTKTFEIRKNDRGYEVGAAARHPLNGATYRIDYILDGFEGLAQKYVALAISKEGE